MPSPLLKVCKKCVEAGAMPVLGLQPMLYWKANKRGRYMLRCMCPLCYDPLGVVGEGSDLGLLAPKKPPPDPVLFDAEEYLVTDSKHASDK